MPYPIPRDVTPSCKSWGATMRLTGGGFVGQERQQNRTPAVQCSRLVGRHAHPYFETETPSISSARTEVELVPAVTVRMAPPVAATVPVLVLYSEWPEELAFAIATPADARTQSSAIVAPPDLSKNARSPGACFLANSEGSGWISSARAETELVPSVILRANPLVALSAWVALLNLTRPPAVSSDDVPARARNSAITSPLDLSKKGIGRSVGYDLTRGESIQSTPVGLDTTCPYATAARLRVVTRTGTRTAAYLYFMFSFLCITAKMVVWLHSRRPTIS